MTQNPTVNAANSPKRTAARHPGIDWLRIVCAVAVVLIHIVTAPVDAGGSASAPLLKALGIVHAMLMWAVPCFFMITGFCLLQKDDCSYAYCFRHVGKYLLCLATIGLAQALLEELFLTRTVNPALLWNSLLRVIEGRLWAHMWFVYSIIGVYLVMPVLHMFLRSSGRNAWILTGLLFLFTVVCPFLEEWLSIGVELPFAGFLFYVCAGGIAARYRPGRNMTLLIHGLGMISAVFVLAGAVNPASGYLHPAVCCMAVSVFLLFSRIQRESGRVVPALAKCAWGLYLLHPFFINVALKLLKIDTLSTWPGLRLPLFAMATLALTLGTVYLLRKIPFLRRLF